VSSLGVISAKNKKKKSIVIRGNFNTVGKLIYRMVFPVLKRIQFGTGLFFFWATAKVRLVLKLFWDG
jgi:hypothetical protein